MFEKYNINKMPGHWFLSRMGKRVLRPGGKILTTSMLNWLNITKADEVVEFAPGMGITAREIFEKGPNRYWGVDQNAEAIQHLKELAPVESYTFIENNIIHSGLKDNIATVVVGEAILTMQTQANKQKIINEAFRVLKQNGRYGIHEICLGPDNISNNIKDKLSSELSSVIHVNARPLTMTEWKKMLENAGFQIEKIFSTPMHLLRLSRVIQDEGLKGVFTMLKNVLKTKGALTRIREMRGVFQKYEHQMSAVSIIAIKK